MQRKHDRDAVTHCVPTRGLLSNVNILVELKTMQNNNFELGITCIVLHLQGQTTRW